MTQNSVHSQGNKAGRAGKPRQGLSGLGADGKLRVAIIILPRKVGLDRGLAMSSHQ